MHQTCTDPPGRAFVSRTTFFQRITGFDLLIRAAKHLDSLQCNRPVTVYAAEAESKAASPRPLLELLGMQTHKRRLQRGFAASPGIQSEPARALVLKLNPNSWQMAVETQRL